MNLPPDDAAAPAGPYDPLWRALEAFDRELRGLEAEVRVLTEWYARRLGERPSHRGDAGRATERPSQ
jgi:hypothetical protein